MLPVNISPKVRRGNLRLYIEMEVFTVLGVNRFTILANVTAEHFYHIIAFCL